MPSGWTKNLTRSPGFSVGRAARYLSALPHTFGDENEIFEFDGAAVQAARRDEKRILIESSGKTARLTDQETLLVSAADEVSQLTPSLSFAAIGRVSIKFPKSRKPFPRSLELFVVQIVHLAELARLDDGLGREFEHFKTVESLWHIGAAYGDTVVFKNDAVEVLLEDGSNLLAQGGASRQAIGSKASRAADVAGLVKEARIRNLSDDAESNQGDRMRMHDGSKVRSNGIDRLVKRQLGRGRMNAFGCAIGPNADNVLSAQAALVDARGRDPDVSIRVSNRKVAAGGGCHPIAINATHHLHKFIARMDKLGS